MKNRINWRLYFILLTACIIAIIAVLPYALTLAGEPLKQAPAPFPILVIIAIVQSSVLFAIVLFFGMILSNKVGLGVPIIACYISQKKIESNAKSILKTSILFGLAAGIVIIPLDFVFSKSGVKISLLTGQMPPFWMGILASIYGGIGEEILLRLFFMTFLVWLFSKFKKDENIVNNHVMMWSAIILASILFGLGHLPMTSTLTALTPLVITRAILLNGIPGIVFGRLYWKNGLESAMVAHFSADIAVHAVLPVLLLIPMRTI